MVIPRMLHNADRTGFGPRNVRRQSSDTQAVFSSLGPLLATQCIVTVRGYRALGLRTHVGPFRLAVESSQTPAEGWGELDVVSCRSLEPQADVVSTARPSPREPECHVVSPEASPGTSLLVLAEFGHGRLLFLGRAVGAQLHFRVELEVASPDLVALELKAVQSVATIAEVTMDHSSGYL